MGLKHTSFSLYNNDNISHKAIEHDWFIHCIGYKFLGGKSAVLSTHQNKKRFVKNHRDDSEIVSKFYEILKTADMVIGHNVDTFDLKKLNTRFIANGLDPIIMPPSVDTLKAARRYFKFSSNRLDFLASALVGDKKLENESGLWQKAFNGDYTATKKMAIYCKQDIVITEKVYMKLKNHIHNHPDIAKISGFNQKKQAVCPVCGSRSNRLDGTQNLKSGRFQYIRCLNCDYRYKGEKIS